MKFICLLQGAAILHMLANFLQQENLQNGLYDYLNTYKYSNAETKDLWNVFSRNTNLSLDVKVTSIKCSTWPETDEIELGCSVFK